MGQTEWLIVTIVIMVIGLIGTFLPFLPGIPLIYAGYFIYGIATNWKDYGLMTMILWGIVAVCMFFLDFYSGSIGAKRYGASKFAVFGAIIGGILGFFLANIVGIVVGPFLGAVAGELIAGKTRREALRSGWGTIIGLVAGGFIRIAAALAMIGTFLVRAL